MKVNFKILSAVFLGGIVSQGYAGNGIPVFDNDVLNATTAVANEAKTQNLKLEDIKTNQQTQIQKLAEVYASITSHSGYGDLLNGADDQQKRRYAPASWEVALDILKKGDTLGNLTAYQDYDDEYSKRYNNVAGANAYSSSPKGRNAVFHDDSVVTAVAAHDISENAFNYQENRLTSIERLLAQIEKAPDVKAAMDLNNRLAAENAMAIAEIIRLQSVLIQVQANNLQKENNTVSNEAALLRYDQE